MLIDRIIRSMFSKLLSYPDSKRLTRNSSNNPNWNDYSHWRYYSPIPLYSQRESPFYSLSLNIFWRVFCSLTRACMSQLSSVAFQAYRLTCTRHLLFSFVLCKLYSNSLMSTVNSRGVWMRSFRDDMPTYVEPINFLRTTVSSTERGSSFGGAFSSPIKVVRHHPVRITHWTHWFLAATSLVSFNISAHWSVCRYWGSWDAGSTKRNGVERKTTWKQEQKEKEDARINPLSQCRVGECGIKIQPSVT